MMYARTRSPELFGPVCGMPGVTTVLRQSNEETEAFIVPMSFPYWGTTLFNPRVVVSTNGWISFTYSGNQAFPLGVLPSTAEPNGVIAPQWSDLITGAQGVCLTVAGTAPTRRLAVQWGDARYAHDPSSLLEFEVLVHENTGVIDFLYRTMTNPQGLLTIGIENSTGTAAIAACPTGNCIAYSNVAVRFTPVP